MHHKCHGMTQKSWGPTTQPTTPTHPPKPNQPFLWSICKKYLNHPLGLTLSTHSLVYPVISRHLIVYWMCCLSSEIWLKLKFNERKVKKIRYFEYSNDLKTCWVKCQISNKESAFSPWELLCLIYFILIHTSLILPLFLIVSTISQTLGISLLRGQSVCLATWWSTWTLV